MTPRATTETTLTVDERERLLAIAHEHGVPALAAWCRCARDTAMRAMLGLPVLRATATQIRAAIARSGGAHP